MSKLYARINNSCIIINIQKLDMQEDLAWTNK